MMDRSKEDARVAGSGFSPGARLFRAFRSRTGPASDASSTVSRIFERVESLVENRRGRRQSTDPAALQEPARPPSEPFHRSAAPESPEPPFRRVSAER
jgi:hypothetical protein